MLASSGSVAFDCDRLALGSRRRFVLAQGANGHGTSCTIAAAPVAQSNTAASTSSSSSSCSAPLSTTVARAVYALSAGLWSSSHHHLAPRRHHRHRTLVLLALYPFALFVAARLAAARVLDVAVRAAFDPLGEFTLVTHAHSPVCAEWTMPAPPSAPSSSSSSLAYAAARSLPFAACTSLAVWIRLFFALYLVAHVACAGGVLVALVVDAMRKAWRESSLSSTMTALALCTLTALAFAPHLLMQSLGTSPWVRRSSSSSSVSTLLISSLSFESVALCNDFDGDDDREE